MSKLASGKKFYLVDTTLRDGEQAAGVVFSAAEKLEIAKQLDIIGVDQIEVGTPVMSQDETDCIRAIAESGLKASLMAWNRAVIADLDASIACGVDAVEISCPVSYQHISHKLRSSPANVLNDMIKAVQYASSHGLYISVGMEDASRGSDDFILDYALAAKAAGAHRLRYCDTIGVLNPVDVFERVKHLRSCVDIDIEIHAHNDFGMATANTMAAYQAGAAFLGVTVNGIGERAGNAALEETLMALRHLEHDAFPYEISKLKALCEYVAAASGRMLPPWKPVVGSEIFFHESGIHADGVLKRSSLYEPFSPEDIDLERKIVIGKHSGKAAIKHKMAEFGVAGNERFVANVLGEVRKEAVKLKRALLDSELRALFGRELSRQVSQ